MTQDLFAITVVLDTSILRAAGVASAPFQVLRGLAEAGLVKVLIPELATEEFRTQWRDRNQDNISQSMKALKALSSEPMLPEGVVASARKMLDQLSHLELESLSTSFLHDYMNNNGFSIFPLNYKQAKNAWESYFVGNLPSKKPKFRSDIPDAHIVAALVDLAEKEEVILFASSDKGQRDSAAQTSKIVCFESLEALVKSPQLQPFVAKWETEQKWKSVQETLLFDEIKEHVRDFVRDNGGDLVSWEEVSDPHIPEDNHTATITMYGEPVDIEIGEPQDWGGGILRYRATFLSECLLSFSVFRSEAFDVPDWVSVSIGDFEEDHYFDAEGYRIVIAQVDLSVRIDLENTSDDVEERIENIAFEIGSLELALGDHG
jgi:hypothetical protein